jgi:hypothetical protein
MIQFRGFVLFFFMWLYCVRLTGEGSLWVFEGRLEHVDAALVPDLKSGWVLSGSFFIDPAQMEPDVDAAAMGKPRLAGGIENAEMTVDLYYQVRFAATQGDGLAGYDWLAATNEAAAQVVYFLPFTGQLEQTDWSIRWVQVSLRGDWQVAPLPEDSWLDWKSGFFRLIFSDSAGQTAEGWGSVTLFGPAGEAELNETEGWRAALADLGRLLGERDTAIASLESALGEAREKMAVLQRMLDMMSQQRLEVEAENRRLLDRLEAIPAVERLREASFEAERALLMEALDESETRQALLEKQIEAMTDLAASLRLQLDAAMAEEEAPPVGPETGLPASAEAVPAAIGGTPEATTLVVPILPGPPLPPSDATQAIKAEPSSVDRVERRLGPRKFR